MLMKKGSDEYLTTFSTATKRDFVISPHGNLEGNLRGFNLPLCQQDPDNKSLNTRQCQAVLKPHKLQGTQFIDFTFAWD
jgi:hypothetical protein